MIFLHRPVGNLSLGYAACPKNAKSNIVTFL